MPRIYATSDLHGNLPEVPRDAEVVLIGGDICPDFRPYGNAYNHWDGVDKGGQRQRHWLNTTFRTWLNGLKKRSIDVVAIWGNHDFVGEHKFLVPDLPWALLTDAETVVRGVRVYGTPWVPGLPYWAFYGDQRRLKARAEAIPEDIDVLLTHGPPYAAGDFIPTSVKQRDKYGNFDGEHVGDPTLNAELARIRPRVVVCGHIHEARGQHLLHDSPAPVYNVAAVDEAYNLHNRPWRRLLEFDPYEPSYACVP